MNQPLHRTVHVDLAGSAYDIHIGSFLLPRIGRYAQELKLGGQCLVVTDDNVAPHYLGHVVESLQSHGFGVANHVVPAGEGSKGVDQLNALWQAAVESGLDRRSFVVALGGGVVGDLAGFLAASLYRGTSLVQVPTTLLSMVDSSVGGKTGINLPQGKNLVGAFHQPRLVLADLAVLGSLPAREFAAGMSEVVKYGAIQDREFFEFLERDVESILSREMGQLSTIVERCCAIKAHIVKIDERENAERAFLNFGHTLGHAIENVCGYGAYLHGEAIGIGQRYAARLSSRLSGLPSADAKRIEALLARFDIPVDPPEVPWPQLLQAMKVDKKARDGAVRFVLLSSLGNCLFPQAVPESVLHEEWQAMSSDTP